MGVKMKYELKEVILKQEVLSILENAPYLLADKYELKLAAKSGPSSSHSNSKGASKAKLLEERLN